MMLRDVLEHVYAGNIEFYQQPSSPVVATTTSPARCVDDVDDLRSVNKPPSFVYKHATGPDHSADPVNAINGSTF